MRIVKFPHVGSRAAACPFRFFSGSSRKSVAFRADFLRVFTPLFKLVFMRWASTFSISPRLTSSGSACRTSMGAAGQCRDPLQVAHQRVPHASVKELCMKSTFEFYNSWDICELCQVKMIFDTHGIDRQPVVHEDFEGSVTRMSTGAP